MVSIVDKVKARVNFHMVRRTNCHRRLHLIIVKIVVPRIRTRDELDTAKSCHRHGPRPKASVTAVILCPGTIGSVFGGCLSPLLGSVVPEMSSLTPVALLTFLA